MFTISFNGKAQTFTDNTPAGTETWTVPANVYSLTVQCWGGGGAGGGDTQNGGVNGAGGGAGGSYASSIIAVTPGQMFNYSVGSGGIGDSNNGNNGSPTWFDTVTTVYAQGGAGGQSANGGSPNRAGGTGSTAASFGTTLINGGNGNNGTTAVGAAGGAGGNGGGAGGAQRTTDGNGNNGVSPSGGGGGAFTGGNTDRSGGNGANGRLRITYTVSIPGNTPCDAISVTNISCATLDNTGGTNSGVAIGSCMVGTTNIQDIWIVTTADGNGALEIETNHLTGSANDDTVISAYTGTCSSLSLIDCDDDSGDGSLESYLVLSGLSPNETVYIRIWSYNSSFITNPPGPFEICLNTSTAPTPPNDLCVNATSLACGDNNIAGTTSGASNLNPGVSCVMSTYGVWYTFTGNGDLYQVSVDPETGFDVEMSISSGNCGALSNVNCIDSSGSGGLEYYEFVTTNGVDYYLYVADPFNGSGPFDVGDFTVSINCQTVSPPPNDDPCNAIDLVINGSCVETSGTTLYATPTMGVPAPSCGSYSGGDVWYTVTVPPTGSLTLSYVNGTANDINMAAYSFSGDCSSTLALTQLSGTSCVTSASMALSAGPNNITPGQVLFIRVWEAGNNQNGTFGICATASVPAGTNGVTICSGETSEPMTTDLFCNTGTTTPNPLSGSITSSSPWADSLSWWTESDDPCSFDSSLWRKYDTIDFTVTEDGTYTFAIDDANTSLDDTLGYIVVNDGLFTYGSCATGTYIAGDDVSGPGLLSEITATLSAGVNYTLVTTYGIGATTGTYEWDVDLNPTSAEWYADDYATDPTATPIGYGAFFDPVAAGELPDTNTPGVYSYWVACPGEINRTQVDYTIVSGPTAATIVSGTATGCNTYEVTISIDEPTGTDWYVAYSIDGSGFYEVDGTGFINSNPYTFTVNDTDAPQNSLIELVYVVNINTACETYNFSGSTTTSYNCSCTTWDGSAGDDNWNTAANWSTNMVPTLSDCVVIPNTGSDPIILDGIDAQALSLTINSGAGLTVESLGTITVQEQVDNAGYFVLQSNVVAGNQQDTGQLVQIDDTFSNTGSITMIRETNVRTQDYVYWSSPVQNFSITNIGYSNRYYWIPTIDANLGDAGNWQSTSETMVAGKGYIVRAPFSPEPGNNPDTPTWNTQVFSGVPNNGIITRNEIERGAHLTGNINPGGGLDNIEPEDDNWNLVGNPYPSALSAVDFLAANSNLASYVKLWRHGTKIGQGYGSPFYGNYSYNYNLADYLTYNASGGTQSGFEGYIGAGQGFFVQLLDGSSTAFTPTSVTFNNSMRSSGYNNGQFFRTSNDTSSGRHRIWLDLVDPSGIAYSSLVAYVEGATMENDPVYDAPITDTFSTNIYSMIGTESMIIQGRSLPFDTNDQVPLGFTVSETGTFTLAIQDVDGLFGDPSQDIFVSDLDTGIIHNLKENPYIFSVDEPGTFNNRLVITYTNATLSIDDKIKSEIRIMAPNNEYIKVISGTNQIEEIKVYDLLGRILINKQNINTAEYTINNVPKANGAYIVKVILANGIEKFQKVVLK